jgi:hypothetical protein
MPQIACAAAIRIWHPHSVRFSARGSAAEREGSEVPIA